MTHQFLDTILRRSVLMFRLLLLILFIYKSGIFPNVITNIWRLLEIHSAGLVKNTFPPVSVCTATSICASYLRVTAYVIFCLFHVISHVLIVKTYRSIMVFWPDPANWSLLITPLPRVLQVIFFSNWPWFGGFSSLRPACKSSRI